MCDEDSIVPNIGVIGVRSYGVFSGLAERCHPEW